MIKDPGTGRGLFLSPGLIALAGPLARAKTRFVIDCMSSVD